jgi:hypothetical protein
MVNRCTFAGILRLVVFLVEGEARLAIQTILDVVVKADLLGDFSLPRDLVRLRVHGEALAFIILHLVLG